MGMGMIAIPTGMSFPWTTLGLQKQLTNMAVTVLEGERCSVTKALLIACLKFIVSTYTLGLHLT